MPTEKKQLSKNFFFGELTYKINGLLIEIHKELGPYAREKQFGNLFEKKLKSANLAYRRELIIGDSGNIVDFLIDGKVIVELKAKPFLILQDYDQVKRYLTQTNLQLGLLVNFRSQRLQIKRVLNPNNINSQIRSHP